MSIGRHIDDNSPGTQQGWCTWGGAVSFPSDPNRTSFTFTNTNGSWMDYVINAVLSTQGNRLDFSSHNTNTSYTASGNISISCTGWAS
jgi:hypothetical protein